MEKEVVKEELQERAGEGTTDQENMGEETVMKVAGQPPVEKRTLLRKLRELKRKVSDHLLCTS